MVLTNNQQAFLALVKAGLWECKLQLSSYNEIDFNQIYLLAQEQTVVGLVAAGIEHIIDNKVPQALALQFVGDTLQLEKRNKAMNVFVSNLIQKLKSARIDALLVKGQGIAQCYERPLWRTSGDVDLFLDEANYIKAKEYLISMAKDVEEENPRTLHQGLIITPWEVELYGTLRTELWKRIDTGVDLFKDEMFRNRGFRVWVNGNTKVYIPLPDYDVILVFTHIIQHFFRGGIGLRQICDWCRLLWTYRTEIKTNLLKSRLMKMGLLSEWEAFASLAVVYLGFPVDAMPLYDASRRWERKATCVLKIILKTGNFGHNDTCNKRENNLWIIRKIESVWSYSKEALMHSFVFPLDSFLVWVNTMRLGCNEALGKHCRSDL
jgi:hypothetical protein